MSKSKAKKLEEAREQVLALAVAVWERRERLAMGKPEAEDRACLLARQGYVNILDVQGFSEACFALKELTK